MSISLINTLAQPLRIAAKFINHNEQPSGLSTSRFIQDTSTCLLPKATFARSKADLVENSFLELAESGLVYFVPALIGEKVARKVFSTNLTQQEKSLVSKSAKNLIKENTAVSKKILPIKAAIALTALFIPLTEFTLNYFKNLMTLKVFKKGDFNNIANLENSKEDKKLQTKVQKSAYKNITKAATAFLSAVGLGILIAKKGAKSNFLQKLSKIILAPGTELFKKNKKHENFFNKYFSLDFNSQNGKLVLSKGQLTSCVLIGGAGYFGASKDRGKQNFLETLFRFPLVGFYIITGSDLFEKGFKKLLKNQGKCKETLDQNLNVPSFEKIKKLAHELALKNKTTLNEEYKKLVKQKVLIAGVPFLFSIGFMGFFVAGISNVFTKFRYNAEKKQTAIKTVQHYKISDNPTFQKFC